MVLMHTFLRSVNKGLGIFLTDKSQKQARIQTNKETTKKKRQILLHQENSKMQILLFNHNLTLAMENTLIKAIYTETEEVTI